jgi:hypothetical protein
MRPRRLSARLPWVGPLVPTVVHLPVSVAWAAVGSQEPPLVLLAWQLVAWPLAAFISLATMSPLLLLLRRRDVVLPGSRAVRVGLAVLFSVAASLTFWIAPSGAMSALAVWCFAFIAAICAESAASKWDRRNTHGG